MIKRVVIRRFKRFGELVLDVDAPVEPTGPNTAGKSMDRRFREPELGPVVLAGPNNSGKTTVLQAIAAWSLAFEAWRSSPAASSKGKRKTPDSQAPTRARKVGIRRVVKSKKIKPTPPKAKFHHGRHGYNWVPVNRERFSAVPLSNFDQLWKDLIHSEHIEIEIQDDKHWTIVMELRRVNEQQIVVRPKMGQDGKPDSATLEAANFDVVYAPPMTGLSAEEHPAFDQVIEYKLGQGRPGEVLRNLLVKAHKERWDELCGSIDRLFGYELAPPDASGPIIRAEYRERTGGPLLDIASAGSGFQQVLMLLTFLYARSGSTILVDEPDAHLHVYLQDVIYDELAKLARGQRSQLFLATHSEIIINAVRPDRLYVLQTQGVKRLLDENEKKRLAGSLGILPQVDIMLAKDAAGVLYVEGRTDLDILREWARILGHPLHEWLSRHPFWRPTTIDRRDGVKGTVAERHFEALRLYRTDLHGVLLIDGDGAGQRMPQTPQEPGELVRLRWKRYEIESYLVHPETLIRFAVRELGYQDDVLVRPGVLSWFQTKMRSATAEVFTGSDDVVEALLNQFKARTKVVPEILSAAGVLGLDYTEYYRIAAVMMPEEIHPEVKEKLDAIQEAFGL